MDYASLITPLTTALSPLVNAAILFIQENFVPRLIELFTAPVDNPEMIWIVIPLFTSMILMQLYFGRHREEELGWNTAFGNSIALIFVSLNLMQVLYNQHGLGITNLISPPNIKIYLIIGLFSLSIAQLVINFFHLMPKNIAFFINSAVIVNMLAYISIVLIYTPIPLDLTTLIVSITGLFSAIVIFEGAKRLVPMTKEAKEFIKIEKEKEKIQMVDEEVEDIMQEKTEETFVKDALIGFAIAASLVGGKLLIELLLTNFTHYYNLVISAGLLIGSFYLLSKRELSLDNLNYDGKTSNAIIGIIIGIGLIILITALNMMLDQFMGVQSVNEVDKDLLSIILTIINFVILIPIGSELLFRGVIQRGLKDRLTDTGSVITQGAMYSIMVLNLPLITLRYELLGLLAIPITMLAGTILGAVRERYALEACIAANITANALGFIFWFIA